MVEYCSPFGSHAEADEDWRLNDYFAYAWVICAICVVCATILTVRLIYLHLISFHRPSQQRHIVRILVMVPVYAIDSWLSFRFYWLSVYFDVFRDCYEAIVIYEFYVLLVEYTGGYQSTKNAFEKRPAFKLVAPLCCWIVSPKRGMLRWLNRLTLQYVLLRPFMAFLATCLQVLGTYCPGELTAFGAGYVYVTAINLVSVTVAMYALVLFYVVAKEELKPYNVVPKFLSIKFIIMMSFWQSVMVAGLVKVNVIHSTTKWTSENISTGVQAGLICIEMLIVAVWHLTAFNYIEFAAQGAHTTKIWPALRESFNLVDLMKDIYHSFFSIGLRAVLRKEDSALVGTNNIELKTTTDTDATSSTTSSTQAPFASAILV